MERLNFELPEFTRLMWVSDRAREVWEPRVERIRKAWVEMEWLAVAQGVRRCCITFARPDEFLVQGVRWAKLGLNSLPVDIQGVSNYSYAGKTTSAELGQPFAFRLVLGKPTDVVAFKDAFDANDERQIAQFLGYPDCCYQFYRRVWIDEGMVDTTWPMALGSSDATTDGTRIEVSGPPESNILWRWMGIRAVSHLPCSFNCSATVAHGKKLLEAGRREGFATEINWILEILHWPVEWSALHGIAEIKTPILKISTKTDATTKKYLVQRRGERYPAEGAQGLKFPYQMPDHLHLTESKGFRQGLHNPLPLVGDVPSEHLASDNGFVSSIAMDNAHKPIVDLALKTLNGRSGNIVDLGCGNGVLLKKIVQAHQRVSPFGIEPDPVRVEHARNMHPQFADNFILGDMFKNDRVWDADRRFALALIMPGRLLESQPEQAAELKRHLKEQCDSILVYAYGDWLTRFGNLARLTEKAGLKLMSADAEGLAGLATIA